MAMKVFRHQVAGDMCVAFRNTKALETLTKQQLLDKDFVQQAVEHDMAFMHDIPNTVQYWAKHKKDLFAMIRKLGKPTTFLTLSASEMHWLDLVQLLQRLQREIGVPLEQMNSIYRAQLVNDDPVVCAIYFDRLVRVILNVLRNTCVSPFRPYKGGDYFRRIEFQLRGSTHAHILWLHNAPNKELSMLMPQTLEMANVLLSIDNGCLKRERTQVHQHTHTCYKHNTTRCRFNAPFMPIDECMVVVPFPSVDNEAQKKQMESLLNKYEVMHQAVETTNYDSMEQFWEHHGVTDKVEYISVLQAGTPRATIMLPRSVQQKWMNYFNPWVSSILDSNMDLQIVLDTYVCAAYVVEYVNKANRGVAAPTLLNGDNTPGTPDIREIIREVVREELRRLLPTASRPPTLSIAEAVREDVHRALKPEVPVTTEAPEEPTLSYATMARRPPQAPRQAMAPPRRDTPTPQYPRRQEDQAHVRPEQPAPRKTDVRRTADRRPLCYHCGEADHVYRRCPYRRLGLRGFHPNDPRPRHGERPSEIDEYLRRPQSPEPASCREFRSPSPRRPASPIHRPRRESLSPLRRREN
ncbi:hypothetical protein HPB47_024886 [Ixodes persulcatus]|uniref:Uncharacterized protein n=1 Tax=Ixodes persulcatus TaxID=34615 RepID=A0AC60Q5D7_IXOPE|nr:hypothetical protein HPB47_024886 [Ixodes persulcatus]